MDTRKLDEGTDLIGGIRWSALATGALIAVALQMVLMTLGIAISGSVGDNTPEGGYAFWAILTQLVSIAIGAALTARLTRAERRTSGIAAGVMTWALAMVIGGAAVGFVLNAQLASGAWTAFFSAVLSLAAAIVGGSLGATMGRTTRTPVAGPPITAS